MPESPESHRPPGASPRLLKFMIGYVVLAGIVIVALLVLILTHKPSTAPLPEPIDGPATAKTPAPRTTKTATTFTLFVPNDNALLETKTVTDQSTLASAPYEKKARRALELLFPRLDFLPKGTKLLTAPKKANAIVTLNFSKEFKQLDSQPETPIMLTLDAMARTLGALDSNDGKNLKAVPIRILVEGKPVPILGQFDLNEPWKATETVPDETLNAEDAV